MGGAAERYSYVEKAARVGTVTRALALRDITTPT